MARLSPQEFDVLVAELVAHHGLGKLRQQLLRTNLVVSQRSVATPAAIARTLYPLTAGFAREGLPTQLLLGLWEDMLGKKVDEENAKRLEEIAEQVNACLTTDQSVADGRRDDLVRALDAYRELLETRIGAEATR